MERDAPKPMHPVVKSSLHLTASRGSTCRYSLADRKTQHQENLRDTNRTLGRWANRGCYKQPVDKRAVYTACTQPCVSGAFGASGATQIKDLACYQYVGKFNSVPDHRISKHLFGIPRFALDHIMPRASSHLSHSPTEVP